MADFNSKIEELNKELERLRNLRHSNVKRYSYILGMIEQLNELRKEKIEEVKGDFFEIHKKMDVWYNQFMKDNNREPTH